jgi:hypothetical protein
VPTPTKGSSQATLIESDVIIDIQEESESSSSSSPCLVQNPGSDLETDDDDLLLRGLDTSTPSKGKTKSSGTNVLDERDEREKEIQSSLSRLLGAGMDASSSRLRIGESKGQASTSTSRSRKRRWPSATIHLKEEKAPIFHDFLKFVYPQ